MRGAKFVYNDQAAGITCIYVGLIGLRILQQPDMQAASTVPRRDSLNQPR